MRGNFSLVEKEHCAECGIAVENNEIFYLGSDGPFCYVCYDLERRALATAMGFDAAYDDLSIEDL